MLFIGTKDLDFTRCCAAQRLETLQRAVYAAFRRRLGPELSRALTRFSGMRRLCYSRGSPNAALGTGLVRRKTFAALL